MSKDFFKLKGATFFEGVSIFLLLLAILIAFFAFVFLGGINPVLHETWTLKDPIVSATTFIPSLHEFRYELLNNGNFLWSSLRATGFPMLGNGIQAAPLFPLTLSLIWLPDQLFWKATPIIRTSLIAFGLFLIARNLLRLPLLPSIIFAIFAGLNINVLRWFNHPWQNGLLAGIWYIYFTCQIIKHSKFSNTSFGYAFGLIVCTYSMVTSGFPEASAMSALIAVFLVFGYILDHRQLVSWYKSISIILICHIIGFLLSSIQIFSLIEFIEYSDALSRRDDYGKKIFPDDQILSVLYAQLGFLKIEGAQKEFFNFFVGLFGLFFGVRGIFIWFFKGENRWFGVGCLLMLALYVAKIFGISNTVESVFSVLPILKHSHFFLYFSPMFYISLGYFVAMGTNDLVIDKREKTSLQWLNMFYLISFGCLSLWLFSKGYQHFNNADLKKFVLQAFIFQPINPASVFVFCLSCVVLYQFVLMIPNRFITVSYKPLLSLCCVGWLLIEMNFLVPTKDGLIIPRKTFLDSEVVESIARKIEIPKHELRAHDRNGRFVSAGMSTINNGIAAIMPVDSRKTRNALFASRYRAYHPIDTSLVPWAWDFMSTNISILQTTPTSDIDWSKFSIDKSIQPQTIQGLSNGGETSRGAYFYLEGKVRGQYKNVDGIKHWLVMTSDSEEVVIEANIKERDIYRVNDDTLGLQVTWRTVIPNDWLQSDSYQLRIRQGNEKQGLYADAQVMSLKITPAKSEKIARTVHPLQPNDELVFSTADKNWHIYHLDAALPRAYTANSCVQHDDIDDQLVYLRTSDAVVKAQATLLNHPAVAKDFCNNFAGEFKRVPLLIDKGDNLSLGSIQGPALLIVHDYIYPGWKAVDKNSRKQFTVTQANAMFRAVWLPEDKEYNISMYYQPGWLKWSYWMIGSACLLLLLLWFRLKKVTHSTRQMSGITQQMS